MRVVGVEGVVVAELVGDHRRREHAWEWRRRVELGRTGVLRTVQHAGLHRALLHHRVGHIGQRCGHGAVRAALRVCGHGIDPGHAQGRAAGGVHVFHRLGLAVAQPHVQARHLERAVLPGVGVLGRPGPALRYRHRAEERFIEGVRVGRHLAVRALDLHGDLGRHHFVAHAVDHVAGGRTRHQVQAVAHAVDHAGAGRGVAPAHCVVVADTDHRAGAEHHAVDVQFARDGHVGADHRIGRAPFPVRVGEHHAVAALGGLGAQCHHVAGSDLGRGFVRFLGGGQLQRGRLGTRRHRCQIARELVAHRRQHVRPVGGVQIDVAFLNRTHPVRVGAARVVKATVVVL